nr:DUF5677 domain-containing protein [uncultured Ruegeria sp.]
MTIHITVEQLETVILEECVPVLEKLKFEPTYWRHQLIMTMACNVVESAHAVVLLAKHKKGHDANLIARKVLEGMVDVKMLADSPDYVDCMRLEDAKYWLKQIEEGVAGNPYTAPLGRIDDVQEVIAEHQKQIAELKSKGARKISVLDKFKQVGLEDEYQTVFRNLSGAVHGRLDALIQRHVVEKGDSVGVVAFAETSVEEMQAMLLGVRDWVRETTKVTKEFLESDFPQPENEKTI